MVDLSPAIAEALAGNTIRVAPMVYLGYATGPVRVWAGLGTITSGGQTWYGLGDLGSISSLEPPNGGAAPEVTLTLSCVARDDSGAVLLADLVAKAKDSQSEIKGRPATVYFQHFDEDWQVLGDPLAVFSGLMHQPKISAPGENTRVFELSLEWVFGRRAISPFGYLTDTDQQALFAGDRGLELVPSMQNKSVKWPQF